MLTLNVKVSREIHAIEKLEIKTLKRLDNLKKMIGDEKPPISISQTLNRVAPNIPANVRRAWGPGRKIPAEIKLEVLALLKEGGKPKDIGPKFGISLPSIQKIKEEAGLVKRRSMFAS